MNCKPGDMAVVIKASTTKELIGRFVIVGRAYCDGEVISGFVPVIVGGPSWVCSSVSGDKLPWASYDGTLAWVLDRPINDSVLRPIRPEETPEESTEAMRLLTQLPQKEKV